MVISPLYQVTIPDIRVKHGRVQDGRGGGLLQPEAGDDLGGEGGRGRHIDERGRQDEPQRAGPEEAGPGEAGPEEVIPKEAGPKEARPEETGPKEAGPKEAGPKEAGPEDARPEETGPEKAEEARARTARRSNPEGRRWPGQDGPCLTACPVPL